MLEVQYNPSEQVYEDLPSQMEWFLGNGGRRVIQGLLLAESLLPPAV